MKMKMKANKKIGILALVFLCSCAPRLMEEVPGNESTRPSSYPHFVNTRSGIGQMSRLQSIIYRQTNPRMRLFDQTICIDGKYVSALTRDEAAIVGIPGDVYDKYEEYLQQLNSSLEE